MVSQEECFVGIDASLSLSLHEKWFLPYESHKTKTMTVNIPSSQAALGDTCLFSVQYLVFWWTFLVHLIRRFPAERVLPEKQRCEQQRLSLGSSEMTRDCLKQGIRRGGWQRTNGREKSTKRQDTGRKKDKCRQERLGWTEC